MTTIKQKGSNKQPSARAYLPASRTGLKRATQEFTAYNKGVAPTAAQRSALNYFTHASVK